MNNEIGNKITEILKASKDTKMYYELQNTFVQLLYVVNRCAEAEIKLEKIKQYLNK